MRQCRVGLRIKVHNMLVRTTNKNTAMHFQCFSPQPMLNRTDGFCSGPIEECHESKEATYILTKGFIFHPKFGDFHGMTKEIVPITVSDGHYIDAIGAEGG